MVEFWLNDNELWEKAEKLTETRNDIIGEIQSHGETDKTSNSYAKLIEDKDKIQKELNSVRIQIDDKFKSLITEVKKINPEMDLDSSGFDVLKGFQTWSDNHSKILELGGLHIIGTERHEARRIDNQLRGRAGRQGDPGSSRFFISLEDDIMRRFGGDRLKTIMGWVGMDEDTPIENKLITNAITDVQKRVEGYHFDVRKNLVEYDDVVNKHRELIYEERRKILAGADLKSNIIKMTGEEISLIVNAHAPDRFGEGRDDAGMLAELKRIIPLPPAVTVKTLEGKRNEEIEKIFIDLVTATYEQREKDMGEEKMRLLERLLMLQIIDRLWVDHLTVMENERLQAGWQTLRQVKSADAYKNAGYQHFQDLLETIKHEVAGMIFHVSISDRTQNKTPQSPMEKANIGSKGDSKPRAGRKIGRNEPCPCGSGKKYKHCCGK